MDHAIRSSMAERERECDRMVKTELEAAEALAGLAHFPANLSESRGSESIAERVKYESNDGCNSSFDTFPKCSSNSYEDATNFLLKKPERSGVLTAKSAKDEQRTELGLNPTYPTNCASSGRKSRQNLTEAEIEARKIRRVLANRESARQTIHRRQAIFEELSRKAVDLAWENENLKREKETAMKQFDSLKTKNECLKTQMIKIMNVEAEETREESNTTNEPVISASSTSSPVIIYNQPPFLPFVWPSMIQPTNSVQLQCGGTPAGIVFPSHIPVNKPDSSSCEEANSMMINGPGGPVYLLPYPWLVTLPQTGNEHRPRQHSFNLNDKPKESSSTDSHGRNHTGFPPDGGGGGRKAAMPLPAPVSCEALLEHDDTTTTTNTRVGDCEGEIHQVPVVYSCKRVSDTAAAAEARKRRKELTRLKNHFASRQLRMH